MEHALTLASIITLFVPMPLLVVFSIVSLIRQVVEERQQKEHQKHIVTIR